MKLETPPASWFLSTRDFEKDARVGAFVERLTDETEIPLTHILMGRQDRFGVVAKHYLFWHLVEVEGYTVGEVARMTGFTPCAVIYGAAEAAKVWAGESEKGEFEVFLFNDLRDRMEKNEEN